MGLEDKILEIIDIANKNNKKINISEIEKIIEPDTSDYFYAIDRLNELNIELIPDKINLDYDLNDNYSNSRNDIASIYLRDIGTIKLLSKEEEISLAKEIEEGKIASIRIDELGDNIDKNLYYELEEKIEKGLIAKNKLVSANLRLAVHIAKEYIGRGMQFQDLIQSGNMGLIKAADKFDYQLGYQFSTYATWWIRQSIIRAIIEQSRTIRIPTHVNDNLIRFNRIKTKLFNDLGRDPSISELAKALDISEDKVIELISYSKEPERLDKEVGEDGESSLSDFIPDKSSKSPLGYTVSKKRNEEVSKALSILSDKEIDIMKKRFGFDGGNPMTLTDIGLEYGVSKEAIRQQIQRALKKILKSEYGEKLKELWEALGDEEN